MDDDNEAIGCLGYGCFIIFALILSLVLVPFAIMWFWNSYLIGAIGLGLAKIGYWTAFMIMVVLDLLGIPLLQGWLIIKLKKQSMDLDIKNPYLAKFNQDHKDKHQKPKYSEYLAVISTEVDGEHDYLIKAKTLLELLKGGKLNGSNKTNQELVVKQLQSLLISNNNLRDFTTQLINQLGDM